MTFKLFREPFFTGRGPCFHGTSQGDMNENEFMAFPRPSTLEWCKQKDGIRVRQKGNIRAAPVWHICTDIQNSWHICALHAPQAVSNVIFSSFGNERGSPWHATIPHNSANFYSNICCLNHPTREKEYLQAESQADTSSSHKEILILIIARLWNPRQYNICRILFTQRPSIL